MPVAIWSPGTVGAATITGQIFAESRVTILVEPLIAVRQSFLLNAWVATALAPSTRPRAGACTPGASSSRWLTAACNSLATMLRQPDPGARAAVLGTT